MWPVAYVSAANVSDENWQDALEIDKQGRVKDTLGILALILRNDPKQKHIAYNIHRSGIDIRRDADGNTTLPWTHNMEMCLNHAHLTMS